MGKLLCEVVQSCTKLCEVCKLEVCALEVCKFPGNEETNTTQYRMSAHVYY